MILPMKHVADWRYIRQRKKAKIEKDVIRKNSNLIEYDHRFLDQLLLINIAAYKYETPFIGPYKIVQMWKT